MILKVKAIDIHQPSELAASQGRITAKKGRTVMYALKDVVMVWSLKSGRQVGIPYGNIRGIEYEWVAPPVIDEPVVDNAEVVEVKKRGRQPKSKSEI